MKNPRKISDVWKAIDDQRMKAKIDKSDWQRSYEGINAAIKYIGLSMITTKNDLDKMDVPITKNGGKCYCWRYIEVSKNDIISSKARIDDLLRGRISLKTKEEIDAIITKQSFNQSLNRPKGIATTNNTESKTIDDLDILLGISNYIHREHLVEFRLYDMAYCMIDDIDESVFVADQVKTAKVDEAGQVKFYENNGILSVKTMISILENGSLTCI